MAFFFSFLIVVIIKNLVVVWTRRVENYWALERNVRDARVTAISSTLYL